MKQFIKETLNFLLENNGRFSTKRDYYSTLFKMTRVKKQYGGDPYWENLQDGQWIGSAIVGITGQIKITTNIAKAGDLHSDNLGLIRETPNYLQFTLRAGRGIEHPDTISANNQPARTRHGVGSEEFEGEFNFQLPDGVSLENGETTLKVGIPKPGSPASDAAIKTWLIFGEEILSFVEKNMKTRIGYLDGKGQELAKNTAPEHQYKFNKLEQEKQRAANKRAAQLGRMKEPERKPQVPSEPEQSEYEKKKALARQNR